MVNAIRERYPDDAILSEERGGSVSEEGRTWLLDPVDGTANYMKANPMFCACVSVIEGGSVTHAAVAAPRLGDLYHARVGGGAYRETGGRETPMRVSDTSRLEYAVAGADLSLRSGKSQDAGVERVLSEVPGSCGPSAARASGAPGSRPGTSTSPSAPATPPGTTPRRSSSSPRPGDAPLTSPASRGASLRGPHRHQRRPARRGPADATQRLAASQHFSISGICSC